MQQATGVDSMPLSKGQSGNPAGRAPGSRNQVTLALDDAAPERPETDAGL
jgi:uncharacterized protein DUF5681